MEYLGSTYSVSSLVSRLPAQLFVSELQATETWAGAGMGTGTVGVQSFSD